ncbi:MAG: hypothetical protein JXQ99_26495 [Hyphomicrobiaceae bacterium]
MLMRKWTKATIASTLFFFASLATTSTLQAGAIPQPIQVSPTATPLAAGDVRASVIKVRRGYRRGKPYGRRFGRRRHSRFGHRRRGFRHSYRFGRRFGYGRRFYRHHLYGRRYDNPGFRFGRHYH